MLDRYLRIGLRETGDTKGFSVSSIFGFYLTRADIRHSAVSLLINMGFSVLAIGERMGHEAEKITYRYAHLFPTVQTEMAERLEMERMTKED